MFATLKRLVIFDGARPATGPGAPTGQEMQRYLAAGLLAAVPCHLYMMKFFGGRVLAAIAAAIVGAVAVEVAFAWSRRKLATLGGGAVAYAVMLCLLVPPSAPLWMIALGGAMAVFMGKELFGGTGHHVFSPIMVGKGILLFSFPTFIDMKPSFASMIAHPDSSAWVVTSGLALLGAAAMLVARFANWRILAGIAASAACVGFAMVGKGKLPADYQLIHLLTVNGFLASACFAACDPSTCPRTDTGKWLYGFIIGAMAILLRTFSNFAEGIIAAILFGNLLAPTIDILNRAPVGRRTE